MHGNGPHVCISVWCHRPRIGACLHHSHQLNNFCDVMSRPAFGLITHIPYIIAVIGYSFLVKGFFCQLDFTFLFTQKSKAKKGAADDPDSHRDSPSAGQHRFSFCTAVVPCIGNSLQHLPMCNSVILF